eukprot:8158118-Ditylum_brightwellii.AAC.1
MDREFKKIKPEIELDVNISAAREHVGEIERYHNTLKERCRCVLFDMRPIGIPAAKGISDRFAPHEIVTRRRLNLKHIKAGFSDYIEASTDDTITNDMKFCTQWCVSLDPSGNWQGSQVCFDLETGRVALRRVIK